MKIALAASAVIVCSVAAVVVYRVSNPVFVLRQKIVRNARYVYSL